MNKRRTHPRVKTRIKIKLVYGDAKEFQDIFAKNISKGGIFLATTSPLPKGEKVLVRMMPPGAPCPFDLEGEVAHSIDTPMAIKKKCTPGMGIKFTDLTKAKILAIEQFIKDILSGRVKPEPATGKRVAGPGTTVPVPRLQKEQHSKARSGPGGTQGAGVAAEAAAQALIQDYRKRLDEAKRLLDSRKLYSLFKVDPTAKKPLIQSAYNRLVKTYHPDRAPEGLPGELKELANEVFAEITRSYQMLMDSAKRVEYDLSIGVEREPEDEEEARILAEHRTRYREIYKRQFPERVDKAKHFAEMAEKAAAAGDRAGAVNSYKIALSFDPLNEEYKARKQALEQGG